jgi:hypothetical protein
MSLYMPMVVLEVYGSSKEHEGSSRFERFAMSIADNRLESLVRGRNNS